MLELTLGQAAKEMIRASGIARRPPVQRFLALQPSRAPLLIEKTTITTKMKRRGTSPLTISPASIEMHVSPLALVALGTRCGGQGVVLLTSKSLAAYMRESLTRSSRASNPTGARGPPSPPAPS